MCNYFIINAICWPRVLCGGAILRMFASKNGTKYSFFEKITNFDSGNLKYCKYEKEKNSERSLSLSKGF